MSETSIRQLMDDELDHVAGGAPTLLSSVGNVTSDVGKALIDTTEIPQSTLLEIGGVGNTAVGDILAL